MSDKTSNYIQYPLIAYVLDGIKKGWDIPFPFKTEEDIRVFLGVLTEEPMELTAGLDYVIQGNVLGAEGKLLLEDAWASGDVLTILRATDRVRITNFEQAARFSAKDLDSEFDNLLRMIIDYARELGVFEGDLEELANRIDKMEEDVGEIVDFLKELQEFQVVEDIVLEAGQNEVIFERIYTGAARYNVMGQLVDGTLLSRQDYRITGERTMTLVRSYPAGTVLRATQVAYKNEQAPNTGGGGSVGKNVIDFSAMVVDPLDRGQVNAAVVALKAKLTDWCIVDFGGVAYTWPDQNYSFTTDGFTGITFRNGGFYRRADRGAEYLFWNNASKFTTYENLYLNGGKPQVLFGQQGIYIRGGDSVQVRNCIFEDIGDAPIRYAQNLPTVPPEMTPIVFGVMITGCRFTNCTQVTSNNTGATRVVISNNQFVNSAIKITQRTLLTEYAQTLIIGNMFENGQRVLSSGALGGVQAISCQGARNVIVQDNSVLMVNNNTSFFESYSNSSGSNRIESGDIFIKDNTIRYEGSTGPKQVITLLVHNNESAPFNPPTDQFEVSGNTFTLNAPFIPYVGSKNVQGVVYIGSYGSNGSFPNLTVTNNIVKGKELTDALIGSPENTGPLFQNSNVLIKDNFGAFRYGLFCGWIKFWSNARIQVMNNVVTAPTLFAPPAWQAKVESVDNTLEISGNTLYMTSNAEVGEWNGCINNNNSYIVNQIYRNNMFINKSLTPVRYCFWMWPMVVNSKQHTTFIIEGNTFQLTGIQEDAYKTRPIYINSYTGCRRFDNVIGGNNYWVGDNPPVSDSSKCITVEDMGFRTTDALGRDAYIIQRGTERLPFDTTGGSWRKYEIWSNGLRKQWGREIKTYAAPYSGNTYLNPAVQPGSGSASVEGSYTVRLSTEATVPTVTNLGSRRENAFTTKSVALSAPETETFPYFHYEVEWTLGDNVG